MTRRARRAALALATALLTLPAGSALADVGPLAPSLFLDSAFAPPTGIVKDDFNATGTSPDIPAGVAVDGDRIYVIGQARSRTNTGDINVAVLARRTDGTLDPGFQQPDPIPSNSLGAGKIEDSIAPANSAGTDVATAIVVLPDHRLRILVKSGSAPSTFAVVLGLMPDGSRDMSFGPDDGGQPAPADGVASFTANLPNATPTGLALSDDGHLAVTGYTHGSAAGSKDDTFVSLLNADGTPDTTFGADDDAPADGTVILDQGIAGGNDRGIDVAFRPGGGVVVLTQVEAAATSSQWVLHAFDGAGHADAAFAGDGDLPLDVDPTDPTDQTAAPTPGMPPTGALISYGGWLWATGSTKTGVDTDTFLSRVAPDGSDLQSRRFDLRGNLTPAALVSAGADLAVMGGDTPTLVVVGSVRSDTTTEWAAAAFNRLGGAVADMGMGSIAIPASGNYGLAGVAAGDGWLAAAGRLTDSSTADSSFGTTRLLVDSEKRCNLALAVPSPLEIVMPWQQPAAVTLQATNNGTKACRGAISVAAPYALHAGGIEAPVDTGVIVPGASFSAPGAQLSYGGARRRQDTVAFTVSTADDADLSDNTASLHARFSFCDLSLALEGKPAYVPSEGMRTFEFSIRNIGTIACSGVRLGAGAGTRSGARPKRYSVQDGRSVIDRIAARPAHKLRSGARVKLTFSVRSSGDVSAANDAATVASRVVGVGDSNARRPHGHVRVVRGTASKGHGPLSARRLAVTQVHVALRRLGGKKCRWISSARGRLRTVKAGAKGACTRPLWLRARGTKHWHLAFERRLAPGRYQLLSRATIRAGFREASFTKRDHNRVIFRTR
jgi:hypothetical protein